MLGYFPCRNSVPAYRHSAQAKMSGSVAKALLEALLLPNDPFLIPNAFVIIDFRCSQIRSTMNIRHKTHAVCTLILLLASLLQGYEMTGQGLQQPGHTFVYSDFQCDLQQFDRNYHPEPGQRRVSVQLDALRFCFQCGFQSAGRYLSCGNCPGR